MRPVLSAIVARSKNNVIGVDNDLPWRSQADLRWFKSHTSGKPIILGRKCWQSLPRKPLPNRTHFIVSSRLQIDLDNVHVHESCLQSERAALNFATLNQLNEVVVIGGAQIYDFFFPRIDKLYLTEVQTIVEVNSDEVTLLPNIHLEGFDLDYEEIYRSEIEEQPDCIFQIWSRR